MAVRKSTEPYWRRCLSLPSSRSLASTIDLGSGMTNVIIAMLIASIKGSLVALFFMHLRWDKPDDVDYFLQHAVLSGPVSDRLLHGSDSPSHAGTYQLEGSSSSQSADRTERRAARSIGRPLVPLAR